MKFYRSSIDAKVAGVCGGIGEVLGIDPNIIRVITLASFFFSASLTFWIYIAAAFILPKN
ncbi:MAG: PspC domain-containing protein [Defluviitaleaceae bacterium]|nr:PspC domain-containing protein [Defluviitaleaceae bacterium]